MEYFEDWGGAEEITKAEYQGKEVPLNKPRRLSGGNKKFEVFVRDGDKVKRVTFGDPNMEIRRDDDEARASFRARHSCDTAKDKTSARYWACRAWEKGTTVSELTKSVSVGDKVSWNSSGGTARGVVRQVVREGKVPNIPVDITGTKEEPAARIELLDEEGKPRGEFVGHKLSTLRKSDTNFESYGQVTKMDTEQRIVYGYASVISKDGVPIVDRQGDIITAQELEKAASQFMLGTRTGLTMHKGEPTTTIIHSFPMTEETKKAYQIESPYEAWLIAVKVHDDETWDKVKNGELKDFSIGGKAQRKDV